MKLQGSSSEKGSVDVSKPSKGFRRSVAQGWTSSLAPRFEKKAAAEKKQFYYEGEICESEDLPDGFTKIRKEFLVIYMIIKYLKSLYNLVYDHQNGTII